jgi:hypothetical protein
MLISFDKMPANARVWVYQSDRNLSDIELQGVQQYLESQLEQWAAHGAALVGSVALLYNRFIIISVDEMHNQASGCSIDASTRWLKELGAALNVDFFNRTIVFLEADTLKSVEMFNIKLLVNQGTITPETIIFNNLVSTIEQFNTNWKIAASQSWMKRYFQTANAS